MKTIFAILLAVSTGMHAQTRRPLPKPVEMPKPQPARKLFHPLPVQVWGIPDTSGLVLHPTKPVAVSMPKPATPTVRKEVATK